MSGIVRANNTGQSGAVSNIETIDSDDYVDASIDNAHLADDAVDSDEIAAGAVDTAHIADNQVTAAKIFDLARGSVLVGNASAATAELTIGSNTYVLASDGTDIAWTAASSGPAQASTDEIRGGSGAGDFSAGSNVDKYIPPDLLQKHYGVAKAWVNVASAGTEAAPSYNICSVTDTGTGDRTTIFDIDFDNVGFNIHGLSDSNAGSIYAERTAVGSSRFVTLNNAATPTVQDRYSGMLYFGNQS